MTRPYKVRVPPEISGYQSGVQGGGPPLEESRPRLPAIGDLTAERERIAALRAAVAGEVVIAESIAATQAALRRVFDGFTLHASSAENAPRRADVELVVGRYVLEPRGREDALLGTMPAGTRWLLARR